MGSAAAQQLRLEIHRNDDLGAFAWPGGRIAVSGTLAAGDEALLAAALAHEIGHLLTDGSLCEPHGVESLAGSGDAEVQADAIAQQLLIKAGYGPGALPRLLRRVILDSSSPTLRHALDRRVALLMPTTP